MAFSHFHGFAVNNLGLIPVLEKHKKAFEIELEEVTADSGYCSEKIFYI